MMIDLVLAPDGPHTWDDAACLDHTDLFDQASTNMHVRHDAIDVCNRCPRQARCLAYALEHHEEFGVWGGTTERERRRLRREAARQTLRR